ncbi:Fur family transcriptional regulator [Croceicoccus naphthovorans]|uniref:Fur family transcriptional regulator n=1 Tax=Croceicoccus naphthovorans TaxID=1348774 RepID=A0A0G3XEZ1_9SPHN|nr:transcriptional repressor [Croceicoccus naphthovorans]AKM08958.1 Fur family transcriptional regulator [Croceicoccus naphthovorans]MBB3989249.1 Fur family zinc uptake transcriptional regulator [Croceicoccus naphthovorans]
MGASGHIHSEHIGEALTNAARAALTDAGEQWTDLRADVFNALAVEENPLSAYDIADTLSAARGKRIAPNSVYRILDLFVRNNLANRIESANAYLVNRHPGCRHDCIFLICDQCGRALHLDDDKLTSGLRNAASDAGYEGISTIVELRGTCADCRAAA